MGLLEADAALGDWIASFDPDISAEEFAMARRRQHAAHRDARDRVQRSAGQDRPSQVDDKVTISLVLCLVFHRAPLVLGERLQNSLISY